MLTEDLHKISMTCDDFGEVAADYSHCTDVVSPNFWTRERTKV